MQQIVEAWEGTIGHLSVDDHGTTVLVAFGLPPLAHEDDPVRAIEAAQQARELQQAPRLAGHLRHRLRAGASAAPSAARALRVHGPRRRGQPGRAAPMQANDGKAVLCDHYTFVATDGQFLFESLPPISVKGKEGTISIYTPASARLPGRSQKERAVSGPLPVARRLERAAGRPHARARRARSTACTRCCGAARRSWSRARPDSASTRLADDLLDQAEAAGAMRLLGAREISATARRRTTRGCRSSPPSSA